MHFHGWLAADIRMLLFAGAFERYFTAKISSSVRFARWAQPVGGTL
jgi:hypothetical protein